MAVLTETNPTLPSATQQAVDVLREESAAGASVNPGAVAGAAKAIADTLRADELRIVLGEAGLMSYVGLLVGDDQEANTQLFRLAGNLAFDNDPNRARALEAGLIPKLIKTLSTALSSTMTLKQPTLLLIRAGVGALLNLSLKYDPIRAELAKTDALELLLSLLDSTGPTPVYVVGSWASGAGGEEVEERCQTGSMIATWAINIIEDVLAKDKSAFPPNGVAILASVILPITNSSASTTLPSTIDLDSASDFAETDLELITTAASLLEGLSIDLDLAKQDIAFAPYPPSPTSTSTSTSDTLLAKLFDFVELASPPKYWSQVGEDGAAFGEKGFATVKSAVMRAVVEAPNSDEVMNRLFGGDERSWVVEKLVGWVREPREGREDLLVCAAHMLAALGRKDEHCVVLVQTYGLAPALASIAATHTRLQLLPPATRPRETTQILYGVVSLLRHLSISAKNKQAVGETGVIASVVPLLSSAVDVVGPLQNAVVGLIKHLTAGNVPNSLSLLDPPANAPTEPAPIESVLAIIPRTDDVRLRSEASRILINLIRALFSTRPPSLSPTPAVSPITPHSNRLAALSITTAGTEEEEEARKTAGRQKVVRREVADALAEMVRLSEKYPILINEGVVGLTLLAGSGPVGALLVLDAILAFHAPPPKEVEPALQDPDAVPSSPTATTPTRTASLAISAAGDPPLALDMLVSWFGLASRGQLGDQRSTDVRPEMVTNAAALVITVLRTGEVAKDGLREGNERREEVEGRLGEVRRKVVGALVGASEALGGREGSNEGLKRTVGRALEVVRG